MNQVEINGVMLQTNIGNADWVERFENSIKVMEEKRQEIIKGDYGAGNTAEGMRMICRAIEKFFDDLYGEGTADSLFTEKNDMFEHIDAVEKVVESTKSERKRLNDKLNTYNQKLGGNRQQRRHGGK